MNSFESKTTSASRLPVLSAIFQTPIPEFPGEFYLGLLGCDGRLAWEAANSGLRTLNPGRSLRANHLLGNDWEGHEPATAWLYQTGFRGSVPAIQTQKGTGFEVWSLVGEPGDRYVLPTQVMLVADHLVRR